MICMVDCVLRKTDTTNELKRNDVLSRGKYSTNNTIEKSTFYNKQLPKLAACWFQVKLFVKNIYTVRIQWLVYLLRLWGFFWTKCRENNNMLRCKIGIFLCSPETFMRRERGRIGRKSNDTRSLLFHSSFSNRLHINSQLNCLSSLFFLCWNTTRNTSKLRFT